MTEQKWCYAPAHQTPAPAVAEFVAFGGKVKGLCGAHAFKAEDEYGIRVTYYGTPDGREPR